MGRGCWDQNVSVLELFTCLCGRFNWRKQLTVRGAIPTTAMITLGYLFHLLRDCVQLGSRSVESTPPNKIGPITAFATNPATAELFEVAKLVCTLGIGVYRCRICGVMTRRRESGRSVEMSGHAMIVSHRGVLAWMPFGMSYTHLQ